MWTPSGLRKLFRILFRKDEVEREMDEEMRFHLDMETEDNIRAGMSPHEARRRAMVRFGGVERFKEEARMSRGGRVVEDLVQAVRLALRGLRRSPGFTAVALTMLALGIGANTAIFSVVHAVLLRPLPFQDPDRLVQVFETHMAQGWDHFAFSQMNALDLMEHSTSFEGVGAITGGTVNLTGEGDAERIGVAPVTPGFFQVLGVQPVLGRTFRDSDARWPESSRVALVSEDTWASRFGSDPRIVGRTLVLDGEGHQVVGVLPSGGPWLDSELYVPLALNPESSRDNHFLAVVARLKPGTTLESARAELTPLAARLTARNAPIDEGMGFQLEPSSSWAATDDLRQSLWVFMGAVGFLLLIACMNLANLLLARSAAQRHQVAMCVALGAGRGRVIRGLMTESAVLGLIGAALGIVVARFGLDALLALEPGNNPRLEGVGLNGWVLLFTLVLALGTSFLAGLIPAFRVPHQDVGEALRDGGRGRAGTRSQARARAWLMSAETALSLILLVGAGLLVRSLIEVHSVDMGLDPQNRLTFEVNLPNSYDGMENQAFRDEFLGRLRALPTVERAATVHLRPVGGRNTVMSVIPEGQTIAGFGGAVSADWRLVSPGYFQTLGLSLVRGRDLSHQIPEEGRGLGGELEVVMSQSLAQAVWPGQDPVGERAQLWVTPDRIGTVVGVVEDMRERGPGQDETLAIYMSYQGIPWSPVHFVVQTVDEPRAVLPYVRAILADLDPSLPLSDVRTLDDLIDDSTASRRFTMILLTVFAAVALVLALAGLYGVIADSVHRRGQELGVRVALGASSDDVLRLVIEQGMVPALIGVGLGVIGALLLSRVLQSLLFGVGTTDPLTYGVTGGLLVLAALTACWLPAREALKLDPAHVLREE